jgi:competence protein ComEC
MTPIADDAQASADRAARAVGQWPSANHASPMATGPPRLICLAAGWLAGLAFAAVRPPPVAVLAAAAVLLGLCWARRADARWRRSLLIGLCAVLGGLRSAIAQPHPGPEHVARFNGQGELTFRGLVVAEPDRRDRQTDYRVRVAAVQLGQRWQPAGGTVLVQAPRFPAYAYGDTLRVTAALVDPPAGTRLDYRRYLARRGILSLARHPRIQVEAHGGGNPLRRALLAVKDRARTALALCLVEPEASLATGILLGDARGIPRAVDEAFRVTNTTHIVAISGSNISLLVAVLFAGLGPLLGRRRAVPAVLVVLALYTALVGAEPAVVRAAIMGAILVIGRVLGRPGDALIALFASAWAMTAYRPAYLADLGFQLSFAATAGLLVLAPPLRARLLRAPGLAGDGRGAGTRRALAEVVAVTLAAQLATWPLLAHAVGQVSLVGLAANLLIVPAQPALMALGGLAAIAGSLWLPAGKLFGLLAWLPTTYTLRTATGMARLPYAAIGWTLPAPAVAGYYLTLGLLLGRRQPNPLTGWLIPRLAGLRTSLARHQAISPPAGPRRRPQPPLAALRLVALGTVCGLTWLGALSRPDGLLHVWLLDIGQGDAILVQTPNGRRMLVDGGPSPSAVLARLGRSGSPWQRQLDVVALTHGDADHIGGLPAVLARYDAAVIVDAELPADSAEAAAWRAAVAAERAQPVRAATGGRILLDPEAGVSAEILWPPHERLTGTDADSNNNSVVLRLQYGARSLLLTGDIEETAERALLRQPATLRSDVLKVAHHGSATSTSPPFLAAVAPALALISAGAQNPYGHPDSATLTRLATIPLRRTDRDGTIEVLSDGQGLWVRP